MLGAIACATAPAPIMMIVKRYKASGPVTDTLLPVVGLDDGVGIIIFGVDESNGEVKVTIKSRPDLNALGTGGHGRIVAYKNDKTFVRIDMPYPMQHYITLPNIDKMSYTSAFVGQVSEIQLPYNTANEELGIVTYYDFTK